MADPSRDCYRILELNPDASLDAVKRSYRSLVKLWHPDRYAAGSSMQAIAQEKIKDINLAYAEACRRKGNAAAASSSPGPVRSAYAAGAATPGEAPPPRRPRPAETAEPPRSRPSGRPETADQERARTARPRRPEMREDEPPPSARPASKPPSQPAGWHPAGNTRSFVRLAKVGLVLGLVTATLIILVNRWPTGRSHEAWPVPSTDSDSETPSPATETPFSTLGPSAPSVRAASPEVARRLPAVRSRRREDLAAYPRLWPTPGDSSESGNAITVDPVRPPVTYAVNLFSDFSASALRRDEPVPLWLRSLQSAAAHLDAFTYGNSREDVIKIQGRPDHETDRLLCYGTSTVTLAGGHVASWYRGDTPLKTHESREVAFDGGATFTVGSTKAEVIAIQGLPQHAADSIFQYGSSTVDFREDRVVGWRDGLPALRVHHLVEAPFGRAAVFTAGSSREEVLTIQGKPDFASDVLLQYGAATVQLKAGRVVSWQDRAGVLRARVVPPLSGGPAR